MKKWLLGRFDNSSDYIWNYIMPVVEIVRVELISKYPKRRNLRSLSEEAAHLFINKFSEFTSSHFHPDVEVSIDVLYGRLRHTPRTLSINWYHEHVWLRVQIKNCTIYVDPTLGEFKYLIEGIPDYYISTKKHKWLTTDKKKGKIISWIDENIWSFISDILHLLLWR